MSAGDDAERSDEVGVPPACGGERRQMAAPATMQSEAMRSGAK
jgi:hypothetical protein